MFDEHDYAHAHLYFNENTSWQRPYLPAGYFRLKNDENEQTKNCSEPKNSLLF